MKHILVAALLALTPLGVSAGPYFRLFNPSHPQISAGIWVPGVTTDPAATSVPPRSEVPPE